MPQVPELPCIIEGGTGATPPSSVRRCTKEGTYQCRTPKITTSNYSVADAINICFSKYNSSYVSLSSDQKNLQCCDVDGLSSEKDADWTGYLLTERPPKYNCGKASDEHPPWSCVELRDGKGKYPTWSDCEADCKKSNTTSPAPPPPPPPTLIVGVIVGVVVLVILSGVAYLLLRRAKERERSSANHHPMAEFHKNRK